ncbi:MAG: peptidyl-prolyl cis-trans isomerase [bacterium]|nr:peptidyl-prolyl cis-trans isomerase [bacterium]
MKKHLFNRGLGCLAFLLLVLAPGCTKKAEEKEKTTLAKIGSSVITLQDFEESFSNGGKRYTSRYPLDRTAVLKLKATYLNQMIEEKLILMEAKRLSIDVGKEEIDAAVAGVRKNYGDNESFRKVFVDGHINMEKWREKIRRKLLVEKVIFSLLSAKVTVSPAELEEYYNNNIEEFHSEEVVKARQIFLMDERAARKARERVRSGEDFAAVAMEVSQSPDARDGGDLGFFGRGVMPEEFDDALFTMEVGALSEVVRSTYGYHIFLLEERKEARDVSFEESREKIAEEIKKKKEELLYVEWMDKLREKNKVDINYALLQGSVIPR